MRKRRYYDAGFKARAARNPHSSRAARLAQRNLRETAQAHFLALTAQRVAINP